MSTLMQRFKEITGPFRLLCARVLSSQDRRMAAAVQQDVARLIEKTRLLGAELRWGLRSDVEREARHQGDDLPSPETLEFLDSISRCEETKKHHEVIERCEGAINGEEPPEVHFALSRSHFALASRGNELHAWPALLAALDGIKKRYQDVADVTYAIDVCRWVLDIFADTHRLDIHGLFHRLEDGKGRRRGPTDPDANGAVPVCELDQFRSLYERRDYVKLGNALLAAAPPVMRYRRNEKGMAREVRYLYASLLSLIAPEKSVAVEPLAGDDFPMPGGYDAQLYTGYLFTAARTRRQQLKAMNRGVPSILIAALPKSASEFLCYTLAEVLGAAITRLTIGDPYQGVVYPGWAEKAGQGGCVTHDHFQATPENLAALRAGNIERITVLVRDPRPATWSLMTMHSEWDGPPPESQLNSMIGGVIGSARWIDSWIGAQKAGFPVTFVCFKDLTEDPATVMADLLQAHGASAFIPGLHEALRRRQEKKRLSSNFRKGDNDAWRAHIPSEIHATLWDLIPVTVRDLLGLKP